MGDTLAGVDLSEERREEAIGSIPAADVMVHREEVFPLCAEADFETNRERIRKWPQVRYPLMGEDLSDFRGIVYAPAVL